MHPAQLDERGQALVERIVRQLLEALPQNWAQLHVECGPNNIVSAYAGIPGTTSQWLPVPPETSALLIECLDAQTTNTPSPAQRLVIDCYPDGRLSAHLETALTDPSPAQQTPWNPTPTPKPGRGPRGRRLTTVLAALTVGCLAAAGLVFAFGWRWSGPPDADIELLAAPPPRQQQAFDVLSRWYQAMNDHDIAAAQALSCPNLSGPPLAEYDAMKGNYQAGRDYIEAIVEFKDSGTQVSAKVLYRTFPLTDKAKQAAEVQQQSGTGVSHRLISLVDESGELKVCGGE